MVKRVQNPERAKLIALVKETKTTNVKVGYFADQGTHKSGMSYPTLMFLQEVHGIRSARGIIKRRAFELTMRMQQKQLIGKLLREMKNDFNSLVSTRASIDDFGKETQSAIKATFGDSGIIPGNAPATIAKKGFNSPLIETSDLLDHLEYRVGQKGKGGE